MKYEQINKKCIKLSIPWKICAVNGKKYKEINGWRLLSFGLIAQLSLITGMTHANSANEHKIDKPNHITSLKPQEEFVIKGKLVNAANEPMAGVSILVKGTTTATSSNEHGQYEIKVKKGQVLVFRNVGYLEQEYTVNQQLNVDITMQSSSEDLDEVVVIGYGSQQKKDVTGAIAMVSMKNVAGQALTSPDQALTGQIAGVTVSTSNGAPGGGPRIQVRGIGAVGAGSQPLYVIDGFPVPASSDEQSNPLSSINNSDIESMTVLKDASATAIYGSRGSNGVIIITTKKGKQGKLAIDVTANSGLQAVPRKGRPNMMNGQEFAQFRKEAIEDKIRLEEGREPTINDIPLEYRNPELIGKGTDWYDEVMRTASMSDINVGISSGNEHVRSYVSAGYLNQQGVMLNTGFERFSVRANIDGNIANKFKIGMNIAPTLSYLTGGVRGQGRDEYFGITSPIPAVYNADGSYNAHIQSPGTFGNPNPVMFLKERTNQHDKMKVLMSTYLEYSFLPNLKFKTTFNVDYEDGSTEIFNPSILGGQNAPPPSIPSGSYSRGQYINWLNENTLNYDTNFGDAHSLSALVGYTVQSQKNKSAGFNGSQYPDDDIKTLNAAARITGGTDITDWSLISYLARVNYTFLDRYVLTGTVRSDGSSRFGPNNRWGTFPSIAASWRISEESFLKDVSWIDELKLRASYGLSGNFNIGNYTYMSSIGTGNYIFGGSLAPGRVMNSIGNPGLGWEKMKEFNIGVDFTTLNNRLTFTGNYYQRNTQDLLLNVEVPQSSGFGSVIENRGDVRNRGVELAINSANFARENFTWNTDFNISFNRNKVMALGRSSDPIYSGQSSEGNPMNITQIGQPLGMLFGYRVEGIYQNEEDLKKYPAFPGAIPGNLRMKDVNGDGEITPVEDFEVIGNPYPKFTWGMTNTFRYKQFDLRFMVVGSMGAEMLHATRFYTDNIDGVFNVRKEVANRWRSEANPGDGMVPTTNGSGRGRVMYRDTHSGHVQKTDYAWVRNITFGYTLPRGIKGVLNDVRIYANIQNPFLFTNYDGNPEGTNYNRGDRGALTPGIDYSNYPVPRIYTLGLNFNF